VEQDYGDPGEAVGGDRPALASSQFAVEATYQGTYRLDEDVLEHTALLNEHFGELAGWVASILVRLGDLDLVYLPPESGDGGGG
jgi:hypothetical protein